MSYPRLGDSAMYPRGSLSPSGTLVRSWQPGSSVYANPWAYTSPNPYYDPELGGFFDVIAAPFKLAAKGVSAGAKVAYQAGKGVVKTIPTAAAGFATGGVPGLIAAGGAKLISEWTHATPQQRAQIEAKVMDNISNTDPYGNPYGTSTQQAADSVWNAALARGGQMVAQTPAGQAAIKQELMETIKPFIVPAVVIAGTLLLKSRR